MIVCNNIMYSEPDAVKFYQITSPNQDGHMITDVWQYTESQYERGHWFIQWMFPSDEPSAVNPYAPVVTEAVQNSFAQDPNLRLRLRKSFHQFLDFIGVSPDTEGKGIGHGFKITGPEAFFMRVQRRNHNQQRITRVIRSLFILGLSDDAERFYQFLMEHSNDISAVTLGFWKRARSVPLGEMAVYQ